MESDLRRAALEEAGVLSVHCLGDAVHCVSSELDRPRSVPGGAPIDVVAARSGTIVAYYACDICKTRIQSDAEGSYESR